MKSNYLLKIPKINDSLFIYDHPAVYVGNRDYLLLKPSTILLKQRKQILYTLVFLSFTLPLLMSVLAQINGGVSKIDQNIGATCQALFYNSNEFLNSWISNKEFLINTGVIIMLLLLCLFIGRMATLLYVVYSSQKQVLTLENQTYQILLLRPVQTQQIWM